MPNYREQPVTGSKWVRSNHVSITNPYNSTPSIHFGEEEITELDDGRKTNTPLTGITAAFEDPTITFNLVHPELGNVIGTSSYQEVYIILHSLYMHLAALRDAAEQLPEEPPVVTE